MKEINKHFEKRKSLIPRVKQLFLWVKSRNKKNYYDYFRWNFSLFFFSLYYPFGRKDSFGSARKWSEEKQQKFTRKSLEADKDINRNKNNNHKKQNEVRTKLFRYGFLFDILFISFCYFNSSLSPEYFHSFSPILCHLSKYLLF